MTVPGNLSSPLLATAAAAGGGGAGGVATRSLRFDADASAYLNKTFSTGNRKTYTLAFWVKSSNHSDGTAQGFGGGQIFSAGTTGAGARASIGFFGPSGGGNQDKFAVAHNATGSTWATLSSDALFRDFSAWQHFVVAVDCSQSTASNRVKVYVNGSQIDMSGTYPSDENQAINNNVGHAIGRYNPESKDYFNGYLCDIYFIDGSQLDATSFGAYDDNNVWQAAVYSGTFGTNGFHLSCSDGTSTTTIAEDSSGNNNDFTANNFSVSAGAGNDSLFDVPTNGDTSSESGAGGEVSGNYCTLNPLHVGNNSSNATATNGNLVWGGSNNYHHVIAGTIAISSGKYYWEATYTNASSNYVAIGMCKADYRVHGVLPGYDEDDAFAIYNSAGRYYYNSTSTSAYGTSWTTGDVIGVRYDEGAVYFYKNGTIMNSSPILTLTGSWCPLFHTYDSGQWTVNFGQRPFAHSAPTNHKPLCTSLLPTPAVANGADHFYSLASTGTFGGGTVTDSDAGFTPDLVWVKRRNAAERHKLYDILRGTDGTRYKHLEPDGDDAEGSGESGITSFVAGGYTSEGGGHINSDGQPFISWMWNAGGSTVTNTDGSISVNLRANPTAGISIATYTGNQTSGATIGHGLNDAPAWWVMKSYSHSGMWVLRHKDVANTHYLQWDTDHAPRNAISDVTGDADSTSTVVPIGAADANNNGRTHLALMFAPVPGFSAFGKYKGNGSTSGTGPFINLGFRPAWVMFKNVSAVSNYRIFDSARDPDNYVDHRLFVDSTSAESQNTTQRVDFLSNGFRVLGNSSTSTFNINNQEIIYFAFAEHPFAANGGLAR